MKETTLAKFEQQLFDEKDGSKFSKLVDKLLKKHGETHTTEVLEILTRYVKEGQIIHWRNFLLTTIIKLIPEEEKKQYVSFFSSSITIPELAYWSIDGLLKTDGKNSYKTLIEIIKTENLELSIRAKAIKSISVVSKQVFDRNLVSDPGYWKTEDLRIQEILDWQEAGYPDGNGHQPPKTHESLENPVSKLEKLMARFDKKLEKKRAKKQDLSNPTDWLAIADENDISAIEEKWKLPSNYYNFIKHFSPIKVNVFSKNFYQGLHLYNASNLIAFQAGYSYDANTMKKTADWPSNYIVIADMGANPYCIDIDNITEGEAPIYTCEHGAGKCEFEQYAGSFTDFLKEIIKYA